MRALQYLGAAEVVMVAMVAPRESGGMYWRLRVVVFAYHTVCGVLMMMRGCGFGKNRFISRRVAGERGAL